MPGQGITVSIQAKIEGWQDQIKQIQNALKNIKPGSDLSKGLIKDLQQVEGMINNLGKNMNQRLTSDSQIRQFVDRMTEVEQIFNHIGSSMSAISFKDLNPDYITTGFKDLLQTLEQANNALGAGMEASFQNAIANSKNLQKEFANMKIDPKTMNMDAIREAVVERGRILEKDVQEGLKNLSDFEKSLKKIKNTRDELAARDKFIGTDVQQKSQALLTGQLPTQGTILDEQELQKKLDFFRANLLRIGFSPSELKRIIPDLQTVMEAGNWDEMPNKFTEYLREAQNRTKNSLAKASQDYRDAVAKHTAMSGAQNRLSALRFNNTQAQNEINNIITGPVQAETKSLKDTVNNLRQELEKNVTSSFHGLGNKLFGLSQQGMQDASTAMKDYTAALDQVRAKEQALSKVQGIVQRYFSIYAAVRMASNAIRSMMRNIQELDKTITEIAIVTKMDQNDLWGQMPQYTKLAKNYAASISGVYQVSQLYYQQGLGQSDVMALTEQTLKMARISGLDYAQATDYMTNAVRSFKMEMTDAVNVVDVYSAIAAASASSVTELASAMSKTASSAQAVGSSFENTTAMMAVMIEATRESAENIGSAMKSIISRYGEMTSDPSKLVDSEGQEMSLNRVDKALQTVGISIHNSAGEFRNFDDVIMELAEKWNTIDTNTQRYIATIMAGNRQQSRFLALVSSYDRLKELSETAANSEDASQLQFLKTMDSIEAKTQQFKTSLQSLYTSSGIEKLYKGLLDFGNDFATTLENISGKNGLVGAIANVGAGFTNMATLATTSFGLIKSRFLSTKQKIEYESKLAGAQERASIAEQEYNNLLNNPVSPIFRRGGKKIKNQADVDKYNSDLAAARQNLTDRETDARALEAENRSRLAALNKASKLQGWGMAASAAGMALGAWANSVDINQNRGLKSGLTMGSSALSGLGTGLMVGASAGGPIGALVGGLTALPGIIQGIGMLSESVTERIQKLDKNVTDAKNERIKSKDELKTLTDYKKKYDELNKSQYDSVEKKQEFVELSNQIAEAYPELIKSMDAEGNYVISMAEGYQKLAEAKRNAYREDIIDSIKAETAGLQDADYVLNNIYNQKPLQNTKRFLGLWDTSSIETLTSMDYSNTLESLSQIEKIFKGGDNGLQTVNTVFQDFTVNGHGNNIVNHDWVRSLGSTGKNSKNEKVMFNALSDEGAKALSQLYIDFIGQIQSNEGFMGAVKNLTEKYADSPDYQDAISKFNPTLYKELSIREKLPEYQAQLVNNRVSAYNDELINLFADSTEDVYNVASNDVQKRFASQEITSDFNTWFKELDEETKNDPEKYKEAVKTFYDKYSDIWYYTERQSDYLNGLTDKDNQFYKNLDQYTLEDIQKEYQIKDLTGLNGAEKYQAELANRRSEAMQAIFQQDYGTIISLYEDWAKNNKSKGITDYSQKVGAGYLSEIQSKYQNILANTSLSEDEIASQISGLNGILDIITDTDKFNFEQRNALLTRFKAADLTSLFGLYNFIDQIEQLDIGLNPEDQQKLIEQVKTFSNLIHINFVTEVSSYIDSLENALEGMDTDIANATKGMNVKKAHQLATTLGKNLSDFTIKDGKFYYDQVNDIIAYYDKTDSEYQAALQKRIDNYNDLKEVFDTDGISEGTANIQDNKTTLSNSLKQVGISFDEFEQLYNNFQKQLNSEDGIKNFFDYLESITSAETEAVSNFITQQKAITSLQTIGFDAFWEAANLSDFDDQKEAVLQAAKAQDFSSLQSNEELYKAITPYIGTLLSFFKDANSTVINTLIDSVGTGKKALITVTSANKDYLKDLQGKGLFEGINFDDNSIIGQQVAVLVDAANGIEEIILAEIAQQFTTDAEQLEAYQKYHANKYKNNKLDNFNKLTGNTITYNDFTNYLSQNLGMSAGAANNPETLKIAAKYYGLAMDSAGNFYVQDWSQRITALSQDLQNILSKENASPEEINAARANLETAKRGQQEAIKAAGTDIIKNYQDISTSQKEALANALGEDSALLEKYYIEENGKQKLNLPEFKKELESSTSKIPEYLRTLFLGMFNDITDEYLKDINSSVELVTKGTSSQADIRAFKDKAATLGVDITNSNFSFDDIANAWTLDPAKMYEYVKKQGEKLIADGLLAQEQLDNYIKANVSEQIAAQVDIDSFLQAENRGEQSQAQQTLTKQLKDWATQHWYGVEPDERTLTGWIADIEGGGQEAVDLALKIAADAGKELSSEQINSYYYAQINRLQSFADSIANLTKGSYVAEGEFRTILQDVGMVDSTGVVTHIEKAAAAYKEIYDKMSETGEQTASSLNQVYAQYLTETERDDMDAIEVMGNAMGMTYDALGTLLGKYGQKLETWLNQNTGLYEKIGAGKIRITDFSQFASNMGWQPGSEEYTSAFKTYNDALIELDTKTSNEIYEEISSIQEAKNGERINVTQLQASLGLADEKINTYLEGLGASIHDGILTVTNTNNIPAIMQTLAERANEAGLLLSDQMAELQDSISQLLENITSTISKGIKGGLSNKDIKSLEDWSGLKLDTTRTKDGIKLTKQSAEELYEKLKEVDTISAEIVLDELNSSIDESITGAKELKGVIKDVAEIRATTESDDFKFMDKSIPSGQNNPINYFNNWSEAFKKMNKAGKASGKMKNKMDYSDFYNIITEMGNLAQQTGEIKLSGNTVLHNMEDAAALIEKGAATLNVAADGSIKVDLSKLGIDFSTGAKDLKANVGKGIQEVAKSQIEMLDSMIQLLETIVAMEDLGNIDVDNDSTIEINDIFPKLEYDKNGNLVEFEINQAYEDWRQNVRHQITETINGEKNKDYNEDLAKAAKNLKIDGISFETILGWSPEQLAQQGQEFLGKYTAVMDAFWKAAKSGNYNLDNLIPSIKEVLAGTGYTGEIELGDTTLAIKNGVVLEKVDGKYKTSKGTEYTDINLAVQAEVLEGLEGVTDIEVKADKQLHGKLIIDTVQFDVTVDDKGQEHYTANGETFTSQYQASQYAYQQYVDDKMQNYSTYETYAEWSVRVHGRFVAGAVEIENQAEFQSRTHQEVQELADAMSNGTDQQIVDTAAKIGIKVELTNGVLTEEQRQQLSEFAGIEDKTVTVTVKGGEAKKTADDLLTVLENIDNTDPSISINTDETVGATQTALESISSELSKIAAMKTQTINITKSITTSETTATKTTAPSADIDAITGATGTIGLAKAQGTLMGELGPELIVSSGRYFVAGQNGPEFVDLASDAIVFNHLQTEQLLKHGMSSTRGQAVTNERNAVAFASGNINGGPAMASARAALAALRQLRAQWQAIAGMSAKDFAGLGGSGGGGGGGGNKSTKDKAFVKDLEKWYNWLQRIAVLEEKINYEEAKRNKIASDMIAHGQDYAKSLLESFNYLKEQTAVHQSLADSQQIYFNQRREQMNSASNPFSALYTFDEYGQLKYKNGALAQLSEIISRDELTGKGTYTAAEQYAILKNNGFEQYMQYDSSGNEIDRSKEGWETSAIQAFWDKIDADKEEMQSLHDSIEEHKKAVLEDQEKANEILKEIEDNQISVEDKVLKAIEDTRQREIDELQKQRDAIEESANNLINGLSEQLNREKDMYSQQTSQDELTRLQRQLSILQNSGGSASQIANLQKEIGQKQQDAYFEAQQRQIDTLQQASQNELERLDRQIDLMTESLEYEKENGLLWGAVYEVMAGTPEQITSFITEHDSQYWGVSPTQLTQDTRDILFEAQQFVTYRQEMKDGITGMIDAFNSYKVETEKQLEDTRKLAMDASGANSGSAKKETGGGSGGSPGGVSKPAGGKKVASTSYIDAGNSGHKIHVVYNDGTSSDKLEAHNWDKKIITGGTKTCYCSKCNHYMGIVYPGDAHFSQGGMIDYTGPAMVHGSKSRPESVLNAEQTKILRDNILSNKPNSLINLLQTYNNGYDANALIPTTKEGVIIEQATVEMHVAQIANDYDASRAGEQALEKIMAIARKSQGSTRIGR